MRSDGTHDYHGFGLCFKKFRQDMQKSTAWGKCLDKPEFKDMKELIVGDNPNLNKNKENKVREYKKIEVQEADLVRPIKQVYKTIDKVFHPGEYQRLRNNLNMERANARQFRSELDALNDKYKSVKNSPQGAGVQIEIANKQGQLDRANATAHMLHTDGRKALSKDPYEWAKTKAERTAFRQGGAVGTGIGALVGAGGALAATLGEQTSITESAIFKIDSLLEQGDTLDYALGHFDRFRDLPGDGNKGEWGIGRAENALSKMAAGVWKPNPKEMVDYHTHTNLDQSNYLDKYNNQGLEKNPFELAKGMITDIYKNQYGPTENKASVDYLHGDMPTRERAYLHNPNEKNLNDYAASEMDIFKN